MSWYRTAPRMARSPNGCDAKPIWLAMRPEERDELEEIAALERRSLSSVTRMLTLKGLEAYRKETAEAAAR